MKLPNVVLTCQDGSLVIALLEKGDAVDLVIAKNPDDIAFAKKRIFDSGLNLELVKEWKVCYNDNDAFETVKEKYMNKTDVNILTNWPFQQGNQGAWQEQHKKFKPLLGKTGTMVAHATTQFVSGTSTGIFKDLQNSNTTYLDMSTETRFKPKIGARSGYYVTSNRPYSGKTTIKTIDGQEIEVDIRKYPALPCVLSADTFAVFEEIHKIKQGTFDQFKEKGTFNAEGKPHIAVPKARFISWNSKKFYLDPKNDTLPTSKDSLLFPLSLYDEQQRKSICSQMDLSITRFWLAIMGILDSRSGGWICRSIPMWATDEIYDDAKFFKKYPTLTKHKALILELAGKVKPNE